MNWKEKTLYKTVKNNTIDERNSFPFCVDFISYLREFRDFHKYNYISVVQYDDISDIYVHDTLLQDFDLELFAYGYFPVYSIMCVSDTVILQIDICDY